MTQHNRIAWQSAAGGTEHLDVIEAPIPEPSDGEVRVRVHAAGLNPVDWKLAALPELAEAYGVPIPGGYGNDFAGVVDALGPGVTGLEIGDRVVGGARGHAVADWTVVPAAALTRVPEPVSLTDAATLPIAFRTAVAAIDALHLGADDTVLIGGAAGGVGVFAVQWAVRTGATVIATGSERNHEFLRGLGATPVAYGSGLVDAVRAAAPNGVTAATDLQGTDTVHAAIALGAPPSRISTIAARGHALPDGVTVTGGADAPDDAVATGAALIADGALHVEIERVFPLDQLRDAVDLLRAGHVRGKIVIALD